MSNKHHYWQMQQHQAVGFYSDYTIWPMETGKYADITFFPSCCPSNYKPSSIEQPQRAYCGQNFLTAKAFGHLQYKPGPFGKGTRAFL